MDGVAEAGGALLAGAGELCWVDGSAGRVGGVTSAPALDPHALRATAHPRRMLN